MIDWQWLDKWFEHFFAVKLKFLAHFSLPCSGQNQKLLTQVLQKV
jgi:hypothetical protein